MTELLTRPGDVLRAEIDEELVCRHVERVTHDVTSFVLESPHGHRFAFDAGQYVTVGADVDGHRLERCYTISSAATEPARLEITVKRVPGGPMSTWLADRLVPGGRVHVRGPLGRFTSAEHPAAKYLFLSAGSGITPLMSMTRTLAGDGSEPDIVFVHSARTPRDIVFRAELETLAAGGLRAHAVCEDDAPGSAERWDGPRGRVTLSLLQALAPDLREREVFVCGPAGYMAAMRDLLADAGADPARCHEESFALAGTSAPVPPAGEGGTGTGVAVRFARTGRTVDCPPGTTLLQAGLAAGVPLPSSCGEGLCGTCKSTLLEGEVDMRHNGGIRPREIAQGSVLLCCSTPLGDVVLDA